MIWRILTVIIGFGILFFGYQIYRTYNMQNTVDRVGSVFSVGPTDAELTMVEFLDYSCSFCRNIHPAIVEAVQRDGNVLYIPRPVPFINDDSLTAATLVYRASRQGKFVHMHEQLITNTRPLTEDVIAELVESAGLDAGRFDADADEAAEQAYIDENLKFFRLYQGKGTPMFVLNGTNIYYPTEGLPDADGLLEIFKQARAQK